MTGAYFIRQRYKKNRVFPGIRTLLRLGQPRSGIWGRALSLPPLRGRYGGRVGGQAAEEPLRHCWVCSLLLLPGIEGDGRESRLQIRVAFMKGLRYRPHIARNISAVSNCDWCIMGTE